MVSEGIEKIKKQSKKEFESKKKLTKSELKAIKDRSDDNPIEPDDAFIDFATEDFISKNIRVRPISGVTHADETRDGRASNISRGGGNDDTEEAQERKEAGRDASGETGSSGEGESEEGEEVAGAEGGG